MTQKNTELTDNHFFALFNLPVSFEIDKALLKSTLLDLQKKHHPDNATSDSEKLNAEKNASLINHAFNTLNRDDERANYLLTLSGHDINLDNSISDLDFLDEMMDIRISLDDTDNTSQIKSLENQVATMIATYANAFKSAYDDKSWSIATDNAQKLKFLGKLQDDIIAKYSETLNNHQSDDDLYVWFLNLF